MRPERRYEKVAFKGLLYVRTYTAVAKRTSFSHILFDLFQPLRMDKEEGKKPGSMGDDEGSEHTQTEKKTRP